MIIIFWTATFLLVICALGFILPGLPGFRIKVWVSILFIIFSYGLYFFWGSAKHLPHYYSDDEHSQRIKQFQFRKLLAEFRKQEFRLRLRLEDNPQDVDAEWRLLDLLAIKAIQSGNHEQAVQYWKSALSKIPKNTQNTEIRHRISELINSY